MVKKTTHFFDSVSSSLKLVEETKFENKSANLAEDFHRLQMVGQVYLNGEPFKTFEEKYRNFATEQDVEDFFVNEFFAKLKLPASQQEDVVAYLKKYFHQQGFMFPVTNTINYTLLKAGKDEDPPVGLSIPVDGRKSQYINLTVNETGLTVQEVMEADKLNYVIGNGVKVLEPTDPTTANYIIKAEGTLHFDFRSNAADPAITVKSNKISLGRPDLKPILGPIESRFSWLWEWIAKFLGRNKVELLESEPQEHEDTSSQSSIGGGRGPR